MSMRGVYAELSRLSGRRIGLLGGSFNPAHDGHLHISEAALAQLQLDEVWWLVSPQNPLKASKGMASLPARLAEAKTVARRPDIHVTDIEARLGTQYTIDTLSSLQRYCPRTRFVWLMGADNLEQMPKWRAWTAIFEAAPVAVFARSTYSLRALMGKVGMDGTGCKNADLANWRGGKHQPGRFCILNFTRRPQRKFVRRARSNVKTQK
jgi:nicotinate (nicotinamide) nucleotide adenylyltransferase